MGARCWKNLFSARLHITSGRVITLPCKGRFQLLYTRPSTSSSNRGSSSISCNTRKTYSPGSLHHGSQLLYLLPIRTRSQNRGNHRSRRNIPCTSSPSPPTHIPNPYCVCPLSSAPGGPTECYVYYGGYHDFESVYEW